MKWTDEQKSAINKRNSNILVTASAGSGKTAVLIERVINRVLIDEIDIDKILVVTFTNASALELRDKLSKKLSEKYKEEGTNKSFIKRQIRILNRANISTIHAFCLKIIRSNFDRVSLDPEFKILDEANTNILKKRAITNIIEKEYAKEKNQNLTNLLQLFNYKEDELLEQLILIYDYIRSFTMPFEFLEKEAEKYNCSSEVENLYTLDFGKQIYDEVISELRLVFIKLQEQISRIQGIEGFEKIVSTLQEDLDNIFSILNISNNWDALYTALNEIEFKKMPTYKGNRVDIKEEIATFRKKVLKETIASCQKRIYDTSSNIVRENKIGYEYLKYIIYILKEFDKEFLSLKSKKGAIDFSDIEHIAYEILINNGKITDVAEKFQENLEEIYTDEYQDTSYIQEEILNTISRGNNRFMVGDVKQSIYRFRQAMPEIFIKKSDTYEEYNKNDLSENDTKIVLAKNFRSRSEVIDSINYIFENIMSREVGDINYSGIEVLKCGATYDKIDGENFRTEVNVIDINDNKESLEDVEKKDCEEEIEELKRFEVEAYYIGKRIKQLVASSKISVGEKIKNVEYKDVVILLRSMSNRANVIENVFKQLNIPVFSDVSSSIFDSEEVKMVLNFLRVIDNRFQDIPLVALMYSVVGMFNLDEMVEIRNQDKKISFYECLEKYLENGINKELKDKVLNFTNLINKFENFASSMTIGELLIKIYNETGIYYKFLLADDSKQRKANLDLILNLAVSFEKENGSVLSEYINYIDNLPNKVDTSSSSAKVIGENENVVRIMTIHKSKGLEFPIVILADTASKYNTKELNKKINFESELGVGINIVNKEYNVSYPSVIKQAINSKLLNEIKSEELRLLYVAFTRAKQKLIVFGNVKDYFKYVSNLFIIKKDERVDPCVVLKNESYLKNILTVIKLGDMYKDVIDFNVIQTTSKLKISEENEKKEYNINEKIDSIYSECDEKRLKEAIRDIQENVSLVESIEKMEKIPERVSVSSLKGEFSASSLKVEMPSCLSKDSDSTLTPARKGTLIHFILQILDFKNVFEKEQIKKFIDEKYKEGIITKGDINYINVEDLEIFLNSKIGKQLRQSQKIGREREFILKNSSFSESAIQGIIDLYYEDDKGNIILVDFKTDNILDENMYIKLYKKQLDIYKEALERLFNKKVIKEYIYSFKLGREIEV